jgi:hypothetical protein
VNNDGADDSLISAALCRRGSNVRLIPLLRLPAAHHTSGTADSLDFCCVGADQRVRLIPLCVFDRCPEKIWGPTSISDSAALHRARISRAAAIHLWVLTAAHNNCVPLIQFDFCCIAYDAV